MNESPRVLHAQAQTQTDRSAPAMPAANRNADRGVPDYLRTECHLAAEHDCRLSPRFDPVLRVAQRAAVAKLGVRDLSDYMAWLQTKKLAATSIARHMVAVKLLYRYLQLEGAVHDNPAELLGTQKTWQRVPK